MKALWILTLIGAILGALTIAITLNSSASAPQEAAGFAMACALAIVPYILTRAVQGLGAKDAKDEVNRIISAIKHRHED